MCFLPEPHNPGLPGDTGRSLWSRQPGQNILGNQVPGVTPGFQAAERRGHLTSSPVSLIVTGCPSHVNSGGTSCPHKSTPRMQAAGVPALQHPSARSGQRDAGETAGDCFPEFSKLPAGARESPKATGPPRPTSPVPSKDRQHPQTRSNRGALNTCPGHHGSLGAGASEVSASAALVC